MSTAVVAQAPSVDPADGPPGLIPPTQRRRSQAPIGDVIVDLGFARRETVDAAVAMSREQGRSTGQLLIESGSIRPDQLARALAERFGVYYVDISQYPVDPRAGQLVESEVGKRYRAVPVGFLPAGEVLVAMSDPGNVLTLDELSMITGRKMVPAAVTPEDLESLLAGAQRTATAPEPAAPSLPGPARADGGAVAVAPAPAPAPVEIDLSVGDGADADAPAVKLVHQIVSEAVRLGASDIHCDPESGDMKVLYRVDGVLAHATTVPRAMAASVVSRVKIMANMNIAERRLPQDGRMPVTIDSRRVDVRVVTLPLVKGEGVVMRILDTGAVVRDLASLGMQAPERDRFLAAIHKPYGAVLVTGPTGSGKSTTLYGGLAVINDGARSILTIEDPVESPIGGIKQMQVAVKAGVTFAAGLRAILRADPDVIMVGEIRDRETAEIAIQAALTGHLMLSTLHTRDAASAVTRLVDMGIEPFMVSAAIDCVVGQRLARALCESCKRPARLTDEVLAEHGLQGAEVFEPAGCGRCGESGYRGRVGLYEVMSVTEEIRALLLGHEGVDRIAAAARSGGMRTMREDGLDKVRQGLTSLVEVARVTTRV